MPSVKSLNLSIPYFKVTDIKLWFFRFENYFCINALICNDTSSATQARFFQTKMKIAYERFYLDRTPKGHMT